MESTSSALGLIVIVVLYIAIGVMSAAGSIYLSKLILSAKQEQIFFGLFLIPIAGFYLAFAAHLRVLPRGTWRAARGQRAQPRLFSDGCDLRTRQVSVQGSPC